MRSYAGVDWASEKHDVLIEDETGEELFAGGFAHDEAGLRSLCRTLVGMKVELVAIERPDGLLVERLLDAGLRVLPMHPNLTNQLRAELERFWPGPIGLFKDLDSPISLAFLKRYPSPKDARSLGEKRMQGFLAGQHYSGGKHPAELVAKLRRAPEGRAGERECEARRAVVLSLIAALEPIVASIKQLECKIALDLRTHPDGEIFRSLFKDPNSVVTAATMVAEIGDCRARYPTRDALAGDAGQAAVALQSGKRKVACFRWACNKRLRDAFCTLADSTRHWHPWAAEHYARSIARGHDHQRAIRSLGRAWCRIVWQCWQARTPYDPARHRALPTAHHGHDPHRVGARGRRSRHASDRRRRLRYQPRLITRR
jgi:transposase